MQDACVEMGVHFLSNAKCRTHAGLKRLAPSVINKINSAFEHILLNRDRIL